MIIVITIIIAIKLNSKIFIMTISPYIIRFLSIVIIPCGRQNYSYQEDSMPQSPIRDYESDETSLP